MAWVIKWQPAHTCSILSLRCIERKCSVAKHKDEKQTSIVIVVKISRLMVFHSTQARLNVYQNRIERYGCDWGLRGALNSRSDVIVWTLVNCFCCCSRLKKSHRVPTVIKIFPVHTCTMTYTNMWLFPPQRTASQLSNNDYSGCSRRNAEASLTPAVKVSTKVKLASGPLRLAVSNVFCNKNSRFDPIAPVTAGSFDTAYRS